ncbi:hypothetical protein NL676_019529 [Syzygium grande]|nr:hypothetical protein NL676_019529 [Syzygium grande]
MALMEEAVKEKELAVKRQELLLLPPRRGGIKRLSCSPVWSEASKPLAVKSSALLSAETRPTVPLASSWKMARCLSSVVL